MAEAPKTIKFDSVIFRRDDLKDLIRISKEVEFSPKNRAFYHTSCINSALDGFIWPFRDGAYCHYCNYKVTKKEQFIISLYFFNMVRNDK